MTKIERISASLLTAVLLVGCASTGDLGCDPCTPAPEFPMTRVAFLDRVSPAWIYFCNVGETDAEVQRCYTDRHALIARCASEVGVPEIIPDVRQMSLTSNALFKCVYPD